MEFYENLLPLRKLQEGQSNTFQAVAILFDRFSKYFMAFYDNNGNFVKLYATGLHYK